MCFTALAQAGSRAQPTPPQMQPSEDRKKTEFFGFSVALGDVNGDGYADVAVGEQGSCENAYVFHSTGTAGITSSDDTHATTTISGAWYSVAVGDVNGDGYGDIVVGGNNDTYVFHSAGSTGVASANTTQADTKLTGVGSSVAVGDVNGDGYADVVTGMGPNKVYVFHSAGSAGVASTDQTHAATTLTGTPANSWFGAVVAVGDVNGDGYADVVVGTEAGFLGPFYNRAYVFHSAGNAGVPSADDAHATTMLSGSTKTGGFCQSASVSDVNGDGYADLVVGSGSGVYVFHSAGSAGVKSANDATATTTLGGFSGFSLAR